MSTGLSPFYFTIIWQKHEHRNPDIVYLIRGSYSKRFSNLHNSIVRQKQQQQNKQTKTLIKKWEIDLNRHFSKHEDIQMAKNYVKNAFSDHQGNASQYHQEMSRHSSSGLYHQTEKKCWQGQKEGSLAHFW